MQTIKKTKTKQKTTITIQHKKTTKRVFKKKSSIAHQASQLQPQKQKKQT